MKQVVVDTDIVIDCLRQPDKKTLFEKLTQKKSLRVLLPMVCLTELYVGESAGRDQQEKRLKETVSKTKLILANENISKRAGILIRNSPNLYLADALVAATSLEKQVPLCSFNKPHFENIPDLELFAYEEFKN